MTDVGSGIEFPSYVDFNLLVVAALCWRWLGKRVPTLFVGDGSGKEYPLIVEFFFEIGDGSGKEYPLTCVDFLYEL